MDLTDKIALVTGASRGIGLAIAEALIDRGATVYGFARSEEDLEDHHRRHGDAFRPLVGDVRKEEDVNGAVETVLDEAGRVDVLINNAGLGRFGRVDELPVEEFDLQMETNVRGYFLATRAVTPAMRAQNEESGFGGHVVNIVSIAGLVGNPELSGYNASKYAVTGMSESLMKELREDGIKVTAIYPGSTESHFSDEAGSDIAPNPMKATDVAETVAHVISGPDNYLISDVVMRPLRPRG